MNKEQQIKEIIESVQKAADEALQKMKELEKEETNAWPWYPQLNERYYFLSSSGAITTNMYFKELDKKWFIDTYDRGLTAPATEEGKKTLEQRDEWFRFMFKFMTAGDVSAYGAGHAFWINIYNNIIISYGDSTSMLSHKKFSSLDKIDTFVKSFGDGDYDKGLEYIRKMLTGGLR